MQSYEGEYSHPYIDTQINQPGMRDYVQQLIEEEKANMDPFTYEEEDIGPPPQKCMLLDSYPSLEARFEDLMQQKGLLEVLIMRRKEFWGGEDNKLNKLISLVEKQKKFLQEEINEINLDRQKTQSEAGERIERLTQSELQLKDQIRKLEIAILKEKFFD